MVATQQGANSIFTHINTIVHSWEQIYTFVWGALYSLLQCELC